MSRVPETALVHRHTYTTRVIRTINTFTDSEPLAPDVGTLQLIVVRVVIDHLHAARAVGVAVEAAIERRRHDELPQRWQGG